MKNKGQSISINTIIIAAIALAVLVVLFAIFTGRIGKFSIGVDETDTCEQKCTSLNMNLRSPAGPDKDCGEDTYIAGSYKNARDGCCCREKFN